MAGAEMNFCTGCARLGIASGLITRIGNDPFGEFTLRQLRSENIDCSHVSLDAERSSPLIFKERQPDGSFRVFYRRDNTAGKIIECNRSMQTYVRRAQAFLYTGIFPALSSDNNRGLLTLLQAAKAGGTLRIFDPNIRMKLLQTPQRARRLLRPLIGHADLVLLGEEEARILLGSLSLERWFQCLAAMGVKHAVIKQQEQGATSMVDGSRYNTPAFAAEVVDTCGAGDAFNAGYVCGVLRKLKPRDCLRLGAFCGARAVTSESDNEALPFWQEAKNYGAATEAAR